MVSPESRLQTLDGNVSWLLGLESEQPEVEDDIIELRFVEDQQQFANPYHDARGRFAHGSGKHETWSIDEKSDSITWNLGVTEDFEIPSGSRKGEVIQRDFASGSAHVLLRPEGMVLNSILLDEKLRGLGLAKELVKKPVEEAKKRGLSLTTTGVYSNDGRVLR